jgi:hypothetical protein
MSEEIDSEKEKEKAASVMPTEIDLSKLQA